MFKSLKKKLKVLLFGALVLALLISLTRLKIHKNKKIEVEETTKEVLTGLGENGSAVFLSDPEEIKQNKILYWKTGYNVVVSNKISVNRTIPDTRPSECRALKYPSSYATNVSIIIIFHNEVLSVLKRTLHSIWNRTPQNMIHEIILVNDASNEDELYEPLKDYVSSNFGDKVKIINLKKRKGLIVTRLEGARASSGKILIFFDSHVEVNDGWLEPLVSPIQENRRIATVPVIDDFSSKTFEYFGMQPTRGAFDWTFTFKELPMRDFEANSIKPFSVPVMLGCAFAIERKFFLYDLGGYDEGLTIWNGENYELSFKLHLCANGLLKVPCSHVGHTFREINPTRAQNFDYVAKNFKRIAEIWLDEYKEILYAREPNRYQSVDAGDLTVPRKVHERLNCKPFKHFLDLASDMVERYPPFHQVPVFASGTLRSLAGEENLCLWGLHDLEDPLTLTNCDSNIIEPKKYQNFVLTFFKQITQGSNDFCLDSMNLSLMDCHYEGGNQYWKFEQETGMIKNREDDAVFCLSANIMEKTVFMGKCDENDDQQKWKFGYVNETALNNWEDINGFQSFL